ncbi:MAG: hypothetical protein R3B90_05905 [Planctomycetaceae bacterium]
MRLLIVCCIAVVGVGCLQRTPRRLDKDAIRASFLRFKDAVVAADATAAADELSTNVFTYFTSLRDAALTATPDDLAELPLARQFQVLRIRDNLTATDLQGMSGRQLAEQFIAGDWLNTDLVSRLKLGNIIHKGDAAEAGYGDEQGMSRDRLVFRREEQGWKLDLSKTSLLESSQLEKQMKSRDIDRVAFLTEVISATNPSRPVADLWRPLLPQAERAE